MRRVLALAALVVFTSCATAPAGRDSHDDIVVLVSFDAFRHDYLDRGLTPNFAKLAARGVRADALLPVFPTKTYPNHHSIATGMYAEHHGIVGNEFRDPVMGDYTTSKRGEADEGRWFGGEPIWVTAERQGVRTASYFWVGTDMVIKGMRPTYWKKYDQEFPQAARVDSVVAWLKKPASDRPRLALLYFEIMDDAGHAQGPDSPQVDSALVQADALLGRLMDGIATTPGAGQTTLVVVSDHGMTLVRPENRVPLDSLVDLTGVRVVPFGTYSTLYFNGDTARSRVVAAALRAGVRHAHVYVRDSIPARYHWHDNPRIPDVLIVADEGWSVGLRRDVERIKLSGQHGYDPALSSMQGIFVAAGPRIRSNLRIPAFENVNVHPFIARLLGIAPAPGIDGRADVLASVMR